MNPDINAIDDQGETELHKVCRAGDLDLLMKLLAEPDIDTSIKNNEGYTALHLALILDRTDLIKAFIATKKTGINDLAYKKDGLLHYAARHGNIDLLHFLLQQPTIDPMLKNKDNLTALHTALIVDNHPSIEVLMDYFGMRYQKTSNLKTLCWYIKEIEELFKPTNEIILTPNNATTLIESKLGGHPYLPNHIDYPENKNGFPLFFLAQINFSEMPTLDPFPQQGILAFYVDGFSPKYGLDLTRPTQPIGFRILYFENIDPKQAQTNFRFLPKFKNIPFDGVFSISFVQKIMAIPTSNRSLHQHLKLKADDQDKFYHAYECHLGSRVGGNAGFNQPDPRDYHKPELDKEILLLQINSEKYNLWGNLGVATFFISEVDLRNKNFSNVLYYWDGC